MTTAAQSTQPQAPDREEARKFLRRLDTDGGDFVFQTFDDSQTRRNPALARTLHGTLELHWSALESLSRQGAGIFVCINRTNRIGKRTKENVIAARAYFADFDKPSPETIKSNLKSFGLMPHMIVKSSSGKWHVYWFIDGVPLEEFTSTQQRLADFLGSDPTVKDLPRVMRLPGFLHQKDRCAPFIVRITRTYDLLNYANADFQAALASAERRSLANKQRSLAEGLAELRSPPDMTQGFPNGHRTRELTKRAGWCLGPQSMTEHEAVQACLHWNSHNAPPLPDEKVRTTVASIAKLEMRKREVDASPINNKSQDKPDVAQAASNAAAVANGWREKTFTAAKLQRMTFEPVRYVVQEYVPEGVTLLIGRPKIGKSWLALDLAVACSSDRAVLGLLKPAQGAVVYLALEDSRRRLQGRIDKLLSPISAAWSDQLTIVEAGGWRRADQGGLEDIEEWATTATKPVLVVIDTLARSRKPVDGKQQVYAADTEAIACLQKIAIKHGLAIVVVHHDRKAEADDPFDTVSGSLGLTGAADTILILKRQTGGGMTLYARGRDIEERETAVHFEKTTCRWSILGEASVVHRSAERSQVIAALTEAGGPLLVGEIMTETGHKRNAADLLLGRMAKEGEIVRVERGRYGLPGQAPSTRQIGQKERLDQQAAEIAEQTSDLSNLSDLSEGDLAPGSEAVV
jgi:AAA domain/RepB DNA-primase from phage plasmid